jgi:hypothetical protein
MDLLSIPSLSAQKQVLGVAPLVQWVRLALFVTSTDRRHASLKAQVIGFSDPPLFLVCIVFLDALWCSCTSLALASGTGWCAGR